MSSSPFFRRRKRLFLSLGFVATLTAAAAFAWTFPIVRLAYALLVVTLEQPRSFYKNLDSRGDKLVAQTVLRSGPPFVTRITLTRAGEHFPTTLVMVTSKTFWASLKWRDDDHAEVVMHVDETGRMIQLRPSVESIQFHYSLIKEAEQTHPPGYFSWGFLWYIKRTF
ncbi:MAG TPA: hypothetical protein VND97_05735 [Beijerinckiaceae bacterium]|nr:hypothetical protein [Beijerinckiaceae bacterium]